MCRLSEGFYGKKFLTEVINMRKYLLPVAGLALVAAANGAFAASSTSNFNVSVTVTSACTVGATDMTFGPFAGSIPANSLATSTVTVGCTSGTSYALSFASGSVLGGATALMSNGTTTIPADLTVSTTPVTGTGGNQTVTINGKIAAAVSFPTPGTYTVPQAIYVNY